MMIMKLSEKTSNLNILSMFVKWIYLKDFKAMKIATPCYEFVKKLDIRKCNFYYFIFQIDLVYL